MQCDDPKCPCHPAPVIKYVEPPSLEILLRNPKDGQLIELHQPHAELDVIFDFRKHAMTIIETVPDTRRPKAPMVVSVQLDQSNSKFVNLQGRHDGSLVLFLKMGGKSRRRKKPAEVELKLKQKISGFKPYQLKSRLCDELALCPWPRKNLELLLPAARTRGWSTAALILLTFRKISTETWKKLMDGSIGPADIAGLDWMTIEEDLKQGKEINF